MHGFARMELPSVTSLTETILEHLSEHVFCELGDPDGGFDGFNKTINDAAKVFAETLKREYTPWACEPVEEMTVNVEEWVIKNEPEAYEDMYNRPIPNPT